MSILATAQPLEVDIKDAYLAILVTKYLAVFSCTLLIYDIIVTLPTEVRYVWASRWSFGRISYHANRCWGPILLAIYVPTLFMYHLSDDACIAVSLFYVYGSVTAMFIVTSVLIVRVWVIYGKKKWILVLVWTGCILIAIPSLVLLQKQAMRKNLVPNPAPDYISGCIFRNNPLAILPYIAPFLYETALFLMTVYKTWKISHGQPLETPLVTRLMRDGSQYYFVVIGTLIFIGLGSLVPAIRPAVNGSGLFIAILSSMCSRLILSTRSFYVDVTATDNWLEMSASSRHRSGETSGTE